ncbi:MarR family winged helix-turn-helix transcriptional regulator [Kitasatospora sp. NPDC101155]|uniref:MarR family winged helix-turn-helix transcriptional regulator n=1 Tax=Kitasatospora sp. NPDC101155 TaxID=3364097 RepID=UPI003808463A
MEYILDGDGAAAEFDARPSLGPGLPDLFADLVRCETRLYNALNDRLRERHGIVTSQYEFLSYLRDHPGCRVADLAAEFAIGVGATSKGIDRLEKQGWAARQPNPSDRRSSLLALTDDGARLVDAAERTFTGALAELLGAALDGPSASALARALATLRSALEHGRIGTPTG